MKIRYSSNLRPDNNKDNFFYRPEDLDDSKKGNVDRSESSNSSMNVFFSQSRDFGESTDSLGYQHPTVEEINEYLSAIVTGERYLPEWGVMVSGGSVIVNYAALKKMVDDGYNIVSAKCITPDMIEVEFQTQKRVDTINKAK